MYKIRSAGCPLIMGPRELAKIGGIGAGLGTFKIWVFEKRGSEKGSTRKHTGNRVTR
jgi:hypothetical protein